MNKYFELAYTSREGNNVVFLTQKSASLIVQNQRLVREPSIIFKKQNL